MSNETITVKKAATILGISVSRVHALIKAMRLPASKKEGGRDYLINLDDLELVKNRKPGNPHKKS